MGAVCLPREPPPQRTCPDMHPECPAFARCCPGEPEAALPQCAPRTDAKLCDEDERPCAPNFVQRWCPGTCGLCGQGRTLLGLTQPNMTEAARELRAEFRNVLELILPKVLEQDTVVIVTVCVSDAALSLPGALTHRSAGAQGSSTFSTTGRGSPGGPT